MCCRTGWKENPTSSAGGMLHLYLLTPQLKYMFVLWVQIIIFSCYSQWWKSRLILEFLHKKCALQRSANQYQSALTKPCVVNSFTDVSSLYFCCSMLLFLCFHKDWNSPEILKINQIHNLKWICYSIENKTDKDREANTIVRQPTSLGVSFNVTSTAIRHWHKFRPDTGRSSGATWEPEIMRLLLALLAKFMGDVNASCPRSLEIKMQICSQVEGWDETWTNYVQARSLLRNGRKQ